MCRRSPFAYRAKIKLHPSISLFALFHPTVIHRSASTTPIFSGSSQDCGHVNPLTHKDWLSPNEVLKIFTNLKDPNSVITVFDQVSRRRDYRPNEALYTLVINKLAHGKKFDEIEDLMGRIKVERSCRLSDGFFYSVIRIYGNFAGRINRAIETLFDMPNYSCWPTVKTFNFVLNLLVSSKQFELVHEVYLGASQLGVEIEACSLNILIKGLCERGNLDAAFCVLDEFPKQRCSPNVRTFSTLMHGLCDCNRVDEAFGLLERMERESINADTITFNILIAGLRKQRRVEEAIELLHRMRLKGCDPNAGSYQEVLYCLLDVKKFVKAKDFLGLMISENFAPSFVSYKLTIHGLCEEFLLEDVDWVLKQMVDQGFVPKMGMWRRVLQSMCSGNSSYYSISYREIVES